MKAKLGLLIFAALFLALCGAGYLAYLHGQASRRLVGAVNRHDAPQVEALLRQGADPNVRDWKTYYEGGGEPYIPPWYEKTLARIMRRPPREGDHYIGPTVLMIAAYNGDLSIAQSLLNHSANVTLKGTSLGYDAYTDPVSALYEAMPLWFMGDSQDRNVLARKQAIALLLVDHEIPVNEHMVLTTPLHCASVRLDPTVAAALIAKGADLNAVDSVDHGPKQTPLLQATNWDRSACGRSHDMRTALLLIASGADVNRQDDQGDTALMHACRFGLTDVARAVMAKGADVSIKNKDGDTALKIAEGSNGVSENGADDGPRTNTTAIIRMLKNAGAK